MSEAYHFLKLMLENQWLKFNRDVPNDRDEVVDMSMPSLDCVKVHYCETAIKDWEKLRCRYIPLVFDYLCDVLYETGHYEYGTEVIELITKESNYNVYEHNTEVAQKIMLKLQRFHLHNFFA